MTPSRVTPTAVSVDPAYLCRSVSLTRRQAPLRDGRASSIDELRLAMEGIRRRPGHDATDSRRDSERIVREEAERISSTDGARQAMAVFANEHPVPHAELEPRVYVRATDNWMELAARFVIPVRTARTTKDELTRRISDRFDAAGIEFASETMEIPLRRAPDSLRMRGRQRGNEP